MMPRLCLNVAAWLACSLSVSTLLAELPDIDSVEQDLRVPALCAGEPAAGKRVKQTHPDYVGTEVYHVLYLPDDWTPEKRYAVIVEYAGNGPYKNRFGDVSSGEVDGSRLGYGLSAGKGYIWLCLPYLNSEGDANVRKWWGNGPEFGAAKTIEYCKKVVPWVCGMYGGDPARVVLAGFSRGAIACNFIGLHDDPIAQLWCGFIPYSHYDGVIEKWPFAGADRKSARRRLARLGRRPQFITAEGDGVAATRRYLQESGTDLGRITFMPTGFRNHSDAWLLRPSPVREALRAWLGKITR